MIDRDTEIKKDLLKFILIRVSHHKYDPEFTDGIPLRFSVAEHQDFTGTDATYPEILNAIKWLDSVKFTINYLATSLEIPALVSWYDIEDKLSFEIKVDPRNVMLFDNLLKNC